MNRAEENSRPQDSAGLNPEACAVRNAVCLLIFNNGNVCVNGLTFLTWWFC